jgi:hypothetical protein
MSFGYVLKEIQVSQISTLVLKSISLESDNSLWSSSIELKFWTNIINIYLCVSQNLKEFGVVESKL